MRHLKTESIFIAFACILFFIILQHPSSCNAASSSLLPENITVSDRFKPGYGPSVGNMMQVQGNVFIIHAGISSAFLASKDLPLYKGDTICTETKARARFKLNDGSIMTLSSATKLIINRSIYDPEKKRRSSFLNLVIGKARFWVRKIFKPRLTAFNVKAGTFVAGVRGSDFVMEKTPAKIEITTLDKTALEITDMKDPDKKPMLLSSFQRTSAPADGILHKPIDITPQEIEIIKKDFFMPEDSDSKPPLDEKKEKTLKPEKPAVAMPAATRP
ncbi:MAG: FecR domain-containing protein, partial [Deltaproteobacteria bacterium]|nr:FecR domain-containing protein [Deltaproteobacteria bacterium]